MKNFNILYVISLILLSTSCASKRNLVYLSDLNNKTEESLPIINNIEPRIQSNDMLSITINTLSSESNMLFAITSNNLNKNGYLEREGYRVNKDGNITLPVVGDLEVKNLTLEEARQKIGESLIRYVKDPIVNIQYLNFRITVIGEVNHPSTFTSTDEKINLLEALGMAGDMTIYGKRENILVMRENDGKRTIARVNLNEKNVLASPYFYLKQNDIVYVEPDKSKSMEFNPNNKLMPLAVATISAIAVLTTALLGK